MLSQCRHRLRDPGLNRYAVDGGAALFLCPSARPHSQADAAAGASSDLEFIDAINYCRNHDLILRAATTNLMDGLAIK